MEPSSDVSFITEKRHLLLNEEKHDLIPYINLIEQCDLNLEKTADSHLMKKTLPSRQTPYDQWSGRVSRPSGAAMIPVSRAASAFSSPQSFLRIR